MKKWCLSFILHPFSFILIVCQRPGGAERVGDGQLDPQAAGGEIAEDLFRQRGLAAEEVGQPGNVQQQARRLDGPLDADQGAETLAPGGQRFQGRVRPGIAGGIGLAILKQS